MKIIDPSLVAPKTNDQLETIETASLDDVTGGCGACGQDCAAGQAPQPKSRFDQLGTVAAT